MQKYYTFETLAGGMDMPRSFRDSLYQRSIYSECAHIRPEAWRKKFTIPVAELDLSCAYN